MNTRLHRGVTLIELMVLIFICAVMLAIFVSILQGQSGARAMARRSQCANNLRNIGVALINCQTFKNHFPNAGTFHDDPAVHQGDPYHSTIYRAIAAPAARPGDADSWLHSWVVEILPYLDCSKCYNAWNVQEPYFSTAQSGPASVSNAAIAATGISVLRCPNDDTATTGKGNLSYVVNGGFARWQAVPVGWSGSRTDGKAANGVVLHWAPAGGTWEDDQAVGKELGVMFLGTETGDQPWDIATRPADITDGASNTLLVAENTLAGASKGTPYSGGRATNWACPLPNFAMFLGSDDVCRTPRSAGDCLGGQLRPGPKGADGKGWSRANQPGTFENINYGRRLTVEGSFPFANSPHPGGGNMVFCDGAMRFISATIDGTVYSKLITPAGSRLPGDRRQRPLDPAALAQ